MPGCPCDIHRCVRLCEHARACVRACVCVCVCVFVFVRVCNVCVWGWGGGGGGRTKPRIEIEFLWTHVHCNHVKTMLKSCDVRSNGDKTWCVTVSILRWSWSGSAGALILALFETLATISLLKESVHQSFRAQNKLNKILNPLRTQHTWICVKPHVRLLAEMNAFPTRQTCLYTVKW